VLRVDAIVAGVESSTVVYVVEDDPDMRAAVCGSLTAAGFDVHVFPSAGAFLAVALEPRAACLVLDMCLPDATGLELQRVLSEREAAVGIVFMSGFVRIEQCVQAIKAGAVQFLPKPFTEQALLAAVNEALTKAHASHRERVARQLVQARYALLTRREREVLACVVRGLPNKVTAAELGISEVTVKIHRSHAMTKMQATSVAELVRMCERLPRREEPQH